MMLPPIPYNGVLRPLLMLIGMAMMFLLLQRTQKKPCRHRKLLWAATAVYFFSTVRHATFANGREGIQLSCGTTDHTQTVVLR